MPKTSRQTAPWRAKLRAAIATARAHARLEERARRARFATALTRSIMGRHYMDDDRAAELRIMALKRKDRPTE